MKIIGFIGIDGGVEMVLKGDSCLLNNRKPFFIPEEDAQIRMTHCIVLRVSRLGKHIAPKFAGRYYDAVAHGADFADERLLERARETGGSWTRAIAFDYSLAVGEMSNKAGGIAGSDACQESVLQSQEGQMREAANLVISPEEAVARASEVMTIRQGDLIYIHQINGSRIVQEEDVIEAEGLYCKVK